VFFVRVTRTTTTSPPPPPPCTMSSYANVLRERGFIGSLRFNYDRPSGGVAVIHKGAFFPPIKRNINNLTLAARTKFACADTSKRRTDRVFINHISCTYLKIILTTCFSLRPRFSPAVGGDHAALSVHKCTCTFSSILTEQLQSGKRI